MGGPRGGIYAPGNLASYGFVTNDPIDLIDPTGELSFAGVLRFTGGAFETAAGVSLGITTSWTGVGAVAGGAIAAHGIDVAVAALTGEDTLTSQAIQATTGASQTTANRINSGISFVGTVGAGVATSILKAGASAGRLAFSQTTANPMFSSQGTFAGQSIGDVAAQLRAGTLAAADVPVQTVNLGGGSLIVNTRSALSLMRAGIPQARVEPS